MTETRSTAKKAPAKKAVTRRRTKAEIERDRLQAEIEILRLQVEAANLRTQAAEKVVETVRQPSTPQKVVPTKSFEPGTRLVFHVLEDGFSLLEKVWLRGEEIFITVGSPDWNNTLNRFGTSVLEMTDREQMRVWGGTVFFRPGPWPGMRYSADNIYEEELDSIDGSHTIVPNEQEIAAIEKANQTRIAKLQEAGYDIDEDW